MLLNRWNELVARHSGQIAFRHPERPAGVTFGQIDQRSRDLDVSGAWVAAVGDSVDFFPSLIAAWRAGKPALLLENGASTPRPMLGSIPREAVLIKQTCGASGLERSLFFTEAQVFAEGMRNIDALGLQQDRRGLAAISLAHSYGFGCLSLPLVLAGVPLDIVASPLPMFMHEALSRGGEVFLPGVPAIWKTWLQIGVANDPAISLALCAGSPLSLELETALHNDCGLKIHNFYGTSETGAIAFDDSSEPRTLPDFVGRLLSGIEAQVDKSGRIIVTSDARAMGADLHAWPGEFDSPAYRTLDQGRISSDGVFVHRCIGQAINVAGRKVSPFRLRTILEQLDGIRAAAVERGLSRDYERFEEIRVRLTVDPGYDKKALREQLRQRVESWEMPRHWDFEVA